MQDVRPLGLSALRAVYCHISVQYSRSSPVALMLVGGESEERAGAVQMDGCC